MKLFTPHLMRRLTAIFLLAGSTPLVAQTLTDLQVRLNEGRLALQKPTLELLESYRTYLGEAEERESNAGNLSAVLALQKELDEMDNPALANAPPGGELPTGYAAPRRSFELRWREHRKEAAQSYRKLLGAYHKRLSALQKSLTQNKKFDQAELVQAEQERRIQEFKLSDNDLASLILLKPEPVPFQNSIVFEDFEGGYENWTITGEAFGERPASGSFANQNRVSGYLGKGLINTYLNGSDKTTGKATSKPFQIEYPFIHFLCGGGFHKKGTCVNLLVNGQPALSASGRGNERLTIHSWNVKEWAGEMAQFEVLDEMTGHYGHINLDHIVFSDLAEPTFKPAEPEGSHVGGGVPVRGARFQMNFEQFGDAMANREKVVMGHRVVVKGTPKIVEGKRGKGIYFGHASSHLDVEGFTWTDSYSIAAWIRLDPGPVEGKTILKASDGYILNTTELSILPKGKCMTLVERNQGQADLPGNRYPQFFNQESSIPTDQWVHIIATKRLDASGGRVHIYQDGKLIVKNVIPELNHLPRTRKWLRIGANINDQGGAIRSFQGRMDDVVIIDRFLEPVEAATLYRRFGGQ